ncbi:unnamed protein product, partial [Staurois parvus]
MTLGRKGLTCGAIKGLNVCCVVFYIVCALLGKHAALYCSATQSNTVQRSMSLLTMERSVFSHRPLPCHCSWAIT